MERAKSDGGDNVSTPKTTPKPLLMCGCETEQQCSWPQRRKDRACVMRWRGALVKIEQSYLRGWAKKTAQEVLRDG